MQFQGKNVSVRPSNWARLWRLWRANRRVIRARDAIGFQNPALAVALLEIEERDRGAA